jgi:hypothetical protein
MKCKVCGGNCGLVHKFNTSVNTSATNSIATNKVSDRTLNRKRQIGI